MKADFRISQKSAKFTKIEKSVFLGISLRKIPYKTQKNTQNSYFKVSTHVLKKRALFVYFGLILPDF